MRDLAKEFTARQTDRKDIDRDLRLLAQPIYRYEKTEGDLIDGGLFAFVLGTDPEAFLMIEARRIDGTPAVAIRSGPDEQRPPPRDLSGTRGLERADAPLGRSQ